MYYIETNTYGKAIVGQNQTQIAEGYLYKNGKNNNNQKRNNNATEWNEMKNKRTNRRYNEKGKLERTPKNEEDMYVCVYCV